MEPASSKSTSQSHHMTFVDDFHYFARQFTNEIFYILHLLIIF